MLKKPLALQSKSASRYNDQPSTSDIIVASRYMQPSQSKPLKSKAIDKEKLIEKKQKHFRVPSSLSGIGTFPVVTQRSEATRKLMEGPSEESSQQTERKPKKASAEARRSPEVNRLLEFVSRPKRSLHPVIKEKHLTPYVQNKNLAELRGQKHLCLMNEDLLFARESHSLRQALDHQVNEKTMFDYVRDSKKVEREGRRKRHNIRSFKTSEQEQNEIREKLGFDKDEAFLSK